MMHINIMGWIILEMLITMSDKEIQRLAVLQDVRDQRITQVRAAVS